MPPGKSSGDADEVYVKDTKLLRTMAGQFDAWETKLREGIKGVDGVTIKPGDFPAAGKLKNTVEKRAKELASAVGKHSDLLKGIAKDLRESADQYDHDDNKNVDAAKDIEWDKPENAT
jgi:hypothetical protein